MVGSDNSKEILEVHNDDIDWFLRDSNISTPNQRSKSESHLRTSPHLTTSISNSNDHISSKTKPTIGTIQEEDVSPKRNKSDANEYQSNGKTSAGVAGNDRQPHTNASHNANNNNNNNAGGGHDNLTRKRTNSFSSIGSNGSSSTISGGGFLNKLKEKFHKSPPTSPHLSTTGGGANGGIFKDNYRLNKTNSRPDSISSLPPSLNLNSTSLPQQNSMDLTDDPKLDEYVKFYSRPSSTSNSRKSSISEGGCLLNPIIDKDSGKNGGESGASNDSSAGRFSFLRRRSSVSASNLPSVSAATEYNRRSQSSIVDPSALAIHKNSFASTYGDSAAFLPNNLQQFSQPSSANALLDSQSENSILPEFRDLKPLKRVAFHSSTFLIDPPQQIPSRAPRKGNVEVLPNGTLTIHPLSEEDKLAIEKSQMGQGGGITVGGSGSLHHMHTDDDQKASPEYKEGKQSNKNLLEDTGDEDEKISKLARKIAIDKPMAHGKPLSYTVPNKKMALDVMYTRCCHLREILPIPAILKQIPKNSMAPIPILQLKNPTPTMIEIQTFADFIRIAPIICISLDGVNLSLEQFRILLGAMAAKTQLEKLSLRNTPIDAAGWSLLCWFLSRNRALSKLDITQCPSLTVNTLKKKRRLNPNDKTKKLEDEIVRMECNKENRSDMDWSLFIASVIARNGIDELIITGCLITDMDLFEKLIKLAVSIKTTRLGLAYNNLSGKQLNYLLKYWLFKKFVRGVDLGYNDLLPHQFLSVLKDLSKNSPQSFEYSLKTSQIGFISLNSTNLVFSNSFKQTFESFLMKLPNLKYLDLSNNAKLFGSSNNSKTDEPNQDSKSSSSHQENEHVFTNEEIIDYFANKIPLFPNLIRLHLENNNLSSKGIIAIANILPFCKNLAYFSLLGNKLDASSGVALIQAAKNSKKLITLEGDFNELPSFFKERLGLYTMRNMETSFYSKDDEPSNGAQKKDDNNLTHQLYEILELKANNKLDINSKIVQDFVKQATHIQYDLQKAVDELNNLQLKKELTLEGKETLVRLIFIDSSISRALKLIDSSFGSEDLSRDYRLSENMNTTNSDENVNSSSDIDNLGIQNSSVPYNRSPSVVSKSSSRTSLNHLDKEEGSVHKLKSTLNGINFHSDQEIFGTEDLSGEEIRRKISSVDLNQLQEILRFVRDLRDKGVEVSQVFKDIKTPKQDGNININYITEKLKSLSTNSNRFNALENNAGGSNETSNDKSKFSDSSSKSKSDMGDSNGSGSDSNNVRSPGNNSSGQGASLMSTTDSKSIKIDSETGESINELYDQVLHDMK